MAVKLETVTALQAKGEANLWLSERLPDRFAAETPRLDRERECWCVPVVLSYTMLGVIGKVGEIIIDANSGQVMDHTPTEEMKEEAKKIHMQHKDAIEAPLL
jgi:hypothetical protein